MDFIAMDFETANANGQSICEIAFAKYIKGEATDVAYSLIRPDGELFVDGYNTMIHGLTESDLEDAPMLSDVWPEIRDFIGDLPLVAHNATQDLKKLLGALEAQGETLDSATYFCTLTMARNDESVPPGEDYSLGALADSLDLSWFTPVRPNGNAGHSAVIDAAAAGELFLHMLKFHGNDPQQLLVDLGMRSGLISNSKIVNGNTKLPKPHPFAGMVAFTKKDFDGIRAEMVDKNLISHSANLLQGKNIVLSLLLESLTEQEFWTCVALSGGDMKTSMTKKVNFLVEGIDPTGRFKPGTTRKSLDARDLLSDGKADVKIIDESEFLNLVGEEIVRLAKEFMLARST